MVLNGAVDGVESALRFCVMLSSRAVRERRRNEERALGVKQKVGDRGRFCGAAGAIVA